MYFLLLNKKCCLKKHTLVALYMWDNLKIKRKEWVNLICTPKEVNMPN